MTAVLGVSGRGFSRKQGGRADRVTWNDVREIVGTQFAKATYDEIFLLIIGSLSVVELGELDENFAEFERMLLAQFPDFPVDWKLRVEAAGVNAQVTLWTRSK